MPKHRVITGFGVTFMTTTGTSAWQLFGPCQAKQIQASATFTGSSNGQSLYLEGLYGTTGSTQIRRMIQRKSSQKQLFAYATSSGHVQYVRVKSTAIKAGGSATMYFSAVV